MNKIETSIEINAPVDKVWRIFSVFSSYPSWSSFIDKMEGSLSEGAQLRVILRQPNKKKGILFTPTVLKVEPEKEFRWLGKFGGVNFLFVGEHYFIFNSFGEKTQLIHGETFRGLLVPLLGGILKNTKIGFENFNKALKRIVERS